MKRISTLASALVLACTSQAAMADFYINVGAISVMPNDSSSHLNVVETVAGLQANSTEAAVNSNTQLGITIDYMIDQNWGVELVAATPFSHDVEIEGSAVDGLDIGSVKHLPPTLYAQYHFGAADSKLRGFVGLGLNYTVFFDEEADSDLINTLQALQVATATDKVELDLDDSFGLAAQVGANYSINDKWGLHLMAAWKDIDTEANVNVNGKSIQKVDVAIDPLVIMAGARYRF